MAQKGQSDRSAQIGERYAGYQVYDRHYEKVGKVDDLFVDESDRPEYIGVKVGLLGTRSTLIPMEIVRVNDNRRLMEVASEKDTIQKGPAFDDDEEITPELEDRIYAHFGLTREGSAQSGGYGAYYSEGYGTGDHTEFYDLPIDADVRREREYGRGTAERSGAAGPGMSIGDSESGRFRGHASDDEDASQRGVRDLRDEDELRVQRSEEELRVGTREREAGSVNVRKRVRTDRQRVRVPKRREEVTVERVPLGGEAAESEFGDDEIRVPVVEEEIVVEKRPVAKEEIRIRKDVVEDEEVIEEDVRREEVQIEDETRRRREKR